MILNNDTRVITARTAKLGEWSEKALSHTTDWQVSLPSLGQCPLSVFSLRKNPSQLEVGVQDCIRVIGPPALQHFWHSPLLATYTTSAPWKVTVWPVMFKFAILLSMAPCSICSITRSEGRLVLKVTLMAIWTLVPLPQVAETYNTFIAYVIESLVNKPFSAVSRLLNTYSASDEEL